MRVQHKDPVSITIQALKPTSVADWLDHLTLSAPDEFLARHPRTSCFSNTRLSQISSSDLRAFLLICLGQGGTETLWDFTCAHLISIVAEVVTSLRDDGDYVLTHESLINDFSYARIVQFSQLQQIQGDLRQKLNDYLGECFNPLPAMSIQQRHYFIEKPIVKFLQHIIEFNTKALIHKAQSEQFNVEDIRVLVASIRRRKLMEAHELYRLLEYASLSEGELMGCFESSDRASILQQSITLV